MTNDVGSPRKTAQELGAVSPEQSLGYQVRRLSSDMTDRMTRFTEEHGISEAQWGYLRHLLYEDGLSQRELSDRVDRQGATTVTALKRMEKSGYVSIRKNENDQRKNRVFLTQKGRRAATELIPYVMRVEEIAFRGFSDAEITLFWDTVIRMRANFERPEGQMWLVSDAAAG